MNQPPASGTLFGHPKGLFLLFSTEMWERFFLLRDARFTYSDFSCRH